MRHVPQDADAEGDCLQDDLADPDQLSDEGNDLDEDISFPADPLRSPASLRYQPVEINVTVLNGRSSTDAEWQAEFTKLFKGYQARLDRHFSFMLPDQEERDDLIQELFIRAYRACRLSENNVGLTHSAAAWSWLVRIGTNLHRDGVRSQEANARRIAILADQMETEQELLSAAADVLERLSSEDLFQDGNWPVDEKTFRERLSQLDAEDHLLLKLRFQHHLEWKEVADEMGITHEATRKRFERMRAFLKTGTAPGSGITPPA